MKRIIIQQGEYYTIQAIENGITNAFGQLGEEVKIEICGSITVLVEELETNAYDIIIVGKQDGVYKNPKDKKNEMLRLIELSKKSKLCLTSFFDKETYLKHHNLSKDPFNKVLNKNNWEKEITVEMIKDLCDIQ